MSHRILSRVRLVVVIALSLLTPLLSAFKSRVAPLQIHTLQRIATVDDRYQSYNVEIAEVVGGNFWKPYTPQSVAAMKAKAAGTQTPSGNASVQLGQDTSTYQARPPIDLTNSRLRKLAEALGPAYVRVSGSWANSAYFHDSDSPAPPKAPQGFDGVLTRRQWRNVVDFARAANARLVTSFAISAGVRDATGVWTPVQARKLIAYTKSIGGRIAAAEMFNEPDMPTYAGAPAGYSATNYARDYAVFRPFIKSVAPEIQIAGPGSVGEGVLMPLMGNAMTAGYVSSEAMLSATPRPDFDIFSYHFYGAASIRCASMGSGAQTTADSALSEEWLSRTDRSYAFYVIGLRNRFQQSKPIWITETADAACGGNPWASTFLDTFRYVDQMGRLARGGVNVLFHNTLASSEYGLLDQKTFEPRPDYWGGLVWRRLMGTTVLDAGPSGPGLHLYAHCTRGQRGGVTVLAINNSRTEQTSIDLPLAAERYTLSAQNLDGRQVRLNGHGLALGAGDALPRIDGDRIPAGTVSLAPATITFLAIRAADNPACR